MKGLLSQTHGQVVLGFPRGQPTTQVQQSAQLDSILSTGLQQLEFLFLEAHRGSLGLTFLHRKPKDEYIQKWLVLINLALNLLCLGTLIFDM